MHDDDPQGVRALANKLSYKPGWHVDCTCIDGQWAITVWTETPCALHLGESVRTEVRLDVNPGLRSEWIVSQVAQALAVYEEHESREWLRLDGAPVRDPGHSATDRCACGKPLDARHALPAVH